MTAFSPVHARVSSQETHRFEVELVEEVVPAVVIGKRIGSRSQADQSAGSKECGEMHLDQ